MSSLYLKGEVAGFIGSSIPSTHHTDINRNVMNFNVRDVVMLKAYLAIPKT